MAGESIPIVEVLANVEQYSLHNVILKGRIKEVHPFPPHMAGPLPILDSCIFTLDDGTNEIEVQVPRHCAVDDMAESVTSRASWKIEARINVIPAVGETPPHVMAIVFRMERLDP